MALPTLTFTSPKGGITADILVKILEFLDDNGVYNQAGVGKPTPLAVIDGHQSRFQPVFLDYVNEDSHKWSINFRVPYKTELWQVGDSSEGNGKLKGTWYWAKDVLLTYKMQKGMAPTIDTTDIIPLLNIAWEQSFGWADLMKQAIADRGWCPANRKLLTHPDVF